MRIIRNVLRRARGFLPAVPPYTLVFLHIPKTGGMSIHEILRREVGRRPRYWINDPQRDVDTLRSMSLHDRGRFALVEGHMYYGVHEVLPRACVYMTMLRDPVERILSLYSHIRERREHHLHAAAAGLSLRECIEQGLTIEMDNYSVRALTSLRHLDVPFGGVTRGMLLEARAHLDGVLLGITERFDESVSLFGSRLNWRDPVAPRINTTARRLRQQDLSPDDLEVIRRSNALDIELYAHALDLFEARQRIEPTVPPSAAAPDGPG